MLLEHVLHEPVPTVDLYLPISHAVHVPPSGPVYPVLHGQLLLAAGENVFTGQAMHSSVPVVALYVPAAHATHDSSDRY